MTLGLEPKVTEGNKFYFLDLHFCKYMYEEGHAQYWWVVGTIDHADIMAKSLGAASFEKNVMPISGYSKFPIEVLAPTLLGRLEEGNFPGWERVRDQLEHLGMTREHGTYLDHLSKQEPDQELSVPV